MAKDYGWKKVIKIETKRLEKKKEIRRSWKEWLKFLWEKFVQSNLPLFLIVPIFLILVIVIIVLIVVDR